ncbi:MAG: trehalose synthase [Solirubrobacteraceae bacterium]|nr:trehalose synthase [Solirubrobacteraceae bacterium]
MPALTHVPVPALPFTRFAGILEPEPYKRFADAVARSRELLDGRIVWNVNSTARGGGVAEMLVSLLAYARGAGVNARWEVIGGSPDFFAITKRLHNNLHGEPGDGGKLGRAERTAYEEALADDARELAEKIHRDDVVILHDPQTAGLIPVLKEIGAPVIWRCHVGLDRATDVTRAAWRFLIPYVSEADAYVFSRQAFTWEGLEPERTTLIAPSIDAFSAKNQDLADSAVGAILAAAGLSDDENGGSPVFRREDGSPDRVHRRAEVFEERPLRHDDRIVVQVSRWDRLKDPLGVIKGFAEHVAPETDAHLVYAGPVVAAVSDDPEGEAVLAEARELWASLPDDSRARIHLACLPMDDPEENGAIVNALQRRAEVVVQKSIAEGFGLTVAEAMWKGRPVVATRIGGIQDQIEDGASGVLLDDPTDLATYGKAVAGLLADPGAAARMGAEARRSVRDNFLTVRSLMQYLDLIERLLEGSGADGQ